MSNELKKIFIRISKDERKKPKELPKLKGKVCKLLMGDLNSGLKSIKDRLKGYDYVYFLSNKSRNLNLREYFQAYSLEKTGKDISCCDYYVFSDKIGDYLSFSAFVAFRTNSKLFKHYLNINQLMFTKSFFLENFKRIRKFFVGGKIDVLTEKNTVFVSIPLVRIASINLKEYSALKEAFRMKFIENLIPLIKQKRILFDQYLYNLIFFGIFKKRFILKYLFEYIIDKLK